jgi:hypothetical protein
MVRVLYSSAVGALVGLLALPGIAVSDAMSPPRGPAAASAAITGSVWREGNVAVPGARVRLRNYATGRLADTTQANDLGRFVFRNLEGGHYLLEVVNETGKVLAIGQPLAVAPGETVATFLRLASKAPWLTGFFQNVAAASVSSASSLGVTAIAVENDPCRGAACCQ